VAPNFKNLALQAQMKLVNIIFSALFGIVTLAVLLSALFDLWKKIWFASVGEVLDVRRTSRYVPNEGNKLTVSIRYRFMAGNREYVHEETKPLEVKYYEEKEAMDSIKSQFPLGGNIVVYHPRSYPEVSSVTPGGAAIPKLVTSFLMIACYFLIQYMIFSHFPG
jgi:hypothetical protein